ncbi:GNAT family N-acetyltransferase [Patulibacter americanus]|uniref:GNAT family N-acetyltransferase n=1 Tax=Patulibacter americanus TaxID=588672 RepID=UPI0003B41D18|nr:GNAT family N-acetyltransferase [Patulibacter americanus]
MSDRAAIPVRPLRESDREAWGALWDGYLAFYEEDLDPQVTEVSFARLCAGDGVFGFVACDADDRPIGLVHAMLHPSTWSPGGYCYLEDLFVGPDARTGGVGRALIETVATEARRRGATKLYWQTDHDNARARALYDQVATLEKVVLYGRELGGDAPAG